MFDTGTRPLGLIAACAAVLFGGAALAQSTSSANAAIDPLVRPGDDFYAYANNAWIKATKLVPGQSRTDITAILRAGNADRIDGLVEGALTAPPSRAAIPARKVALYYAGQLDIAGIEAKGLAPLAGDLAAIAAISDTEALARHLGRSLRLVDAANLTTDGPWGIWIHQGFHDPDHAAIHLLQGGLGLAQPEAYLSLAAEQVANRAFYRTYVTNILRLAGFDQANVRAERVLALETAIAATHASQAETDDVFKTDNAWGRADFVIKAPGLDWAAYFAAAGLPPDAGFVVWQPGAVIGGARLAASQPLEAWRDYLAFHLIDHHTTVLPRAFGDARRAFDARGRALLPPADPKARAIAGTEAALGDAIGQLYVARYVPPQAKAAATEMAENLRLAFHSRLETLTRMSPQTRAKALNKLAGLRIGLAYPDTFIDYSRLMLAPGEAFGNFQRSEAFAYRHEVARLRRPIDPDAWAGYLHPQAVGADINVSPNAMQFTAGLLQPPYFDFTGDPAANYGSAGAGMAHEIAHSFDELGNLYDDRGRLGGWWSLTDLAGYRAASGALAAQLNACCPSPDACAHGRQVLAESAADLAGLAVAHDAYRLSLHGVADPVKGGLTGEQRFFVAYAQRWRRLQTDADLARQIATDPHAAPACRANLVRNLDAWSQAFDVQPSDRLYLKPEDRIRIW